jgi:hypothetical protein
MYLLYRFFECAADGHDLTDALHCGIDFGANFVEFSQVPDGNFDYYVVEARFEAGGGHLGNGITEGGEVDTESKLGGYESERVAGCLGNKF